MNGMKTKKSVMATIRSSISLALESALANPVLQAVIQKIPKPFKTTALLATLALLLSCIMLMEWVLLSQNVAPSEIRDRSRPAIDAGAPSAEAFEFPEEDHYQEMANRPLFMESRRPGQVQAKVEPSMEPTSNTPMTLKLMGIVHTPNHDTALLVDEKGKYKRLKLNDSLNGWALIDLGSDKATLQQNESKETLKLMKKSAHTKPPANSSENKNAISNEEGINPEEAPPEDVNRVQGGVEDEVIDPNEGMTVDENGEAMTDQ